MLPWIDPPVAIVASSCPPDQPRTTFDRTWSVNASQDFAAVVDKDRYKLVGTVVADKYKVEQVVGEGGYGIVYRAHHVISKNRVVALKCLVALEANPKHRDRLLQDFYTEGELLTELSTKTTNIVQAWDIGALTAPTADWLPYLILEWLDGKSLEAWLTHEPDEPRPRRRTGLESFKLMDGPARALALAHIHKNGVAHRDLKPANLFVVGKELEPGVVIKVLDFGIAKVMESQATAAMINTRGLGGLTPQYSAPEQWDRTFGATGPWTDVYQMALILVELMRGGLKAIEGDSELQCMAATVNLERRPTPRFHGLDVSDAVEEVFRNALAVRVVDRYRNMGGFWVALGDALERRTVGPLVPAQPESPEVPQQKHEPPRPQPEPPRPQRTANTPSPPPPPLHQNRPPAPAPGPPPAPPVLEPQRPHLGRGIKLALAGVLVALGLALAIPSFRERLHNLGGGGGPVSLKVESKAPQAEPPEFAAARSAMHALGLTKTQQAVTDLEGIVDDYHREPAVIAAAQLLQAEVMLRRVLSTQIAMMVEPANADLPKAAAADLAKATALIEPAPDAANAKHLTRVQTLLGLAWGELATDSLPEDTEDELRTLVLGAPLWHDATAPEPDGLIASIEGLRNGSSLHNSLLALVLWRRRDDEGARKALNGVLTDDMTAAVSLSAALDRRATEKGAGRESIDELITNGCERVRSGDSAAGIKLLLNAVDRVGLSNFTVCLCLGTGFFANKNYDTALTWFKLAVRQSPYNRNAVAWAARAAELAKKDSVAIEYYRMLLRLQPKNEAARTYLAKHDSPSEATSPADVPGELFPLPVGKQSP